MDLIFLGTSCMKPTKDRGQAAIYLNYNGEGILFDCGEGTQRQMRLADLKPTKIKKILLSHWHGDHMLGLPGLLQTIGSEDYQGKIEIYGPIGSKKFFEYMTKSFYFEKGLDIEIIEIEEGIFFENKDYYLEAMPLDHKVPTLGFSFVEKDKRKINLTAIKKLGIPSGPLLGKLQDGKEIEYVGKKISPDKVTILNKGYKITYVTDTSLCENCFKLAKDSDILITESVYTDSLKEKASEHKHMTAMQSAQIANKSNVKKLILTHFSQRFKTLENIEEEAKTYYKNVICAFDLMKVQVSK